MDEFLELNSPEVFWKLLKENADIFPQNKETIVFTDALNRILAEDIKAPESLPPFNRSTVDGFAVRAKDTAGASESLPQYLTVIGEIEMGQKTELKIRPGEVVKIPTGGMLPAGADAAIMIENTDYLDEEMIETTTAVAVGENVVQEGEDILKEQLLLKKGHLIRPQDIGALAGLGITEIDVYVRPEVAVISTGDELVSPMTTPNPGEIRDINSYAIQAVLEELGCLVRNVGIITDSFEKLKKAIIDNLDCNLILISGGSSVGAKDYTVKLLNDLGRPGVLLHGIAIKPGKPTILGVSDGLPVIGLPGHPASSWTIVNTLVKPLIYNLQGRGKLNYKFGNSFPGIKAILGRNIVSDRGREEYIPVKLQPTPGSDHKDCKIDYLAEPITGKSSLITTLVEADGYIRIETFNEGANQGDLVEVMPYRRD